MMARVGNVLYFLGLALWVGGMAALGAIVAPSLFRSVPKEQAADLFGTILGRFAMVEFGAGIAALAGAALTFITTRKVSIMTWLRIVTLTIMLLVSLGAHVGVNRKVVRLRQDTSEQGRAELDRAHKTSVRLFLFNMIAGAGLLGASAWFHSKE